MPRHEPNCEVEISGIRFRNPVMTAAGPNVLNARLMEGAIRGGVGGVVAKTVSLKPAVDNRPTIRRVGIGSMMNAETWSEETVEQMIVEMNQVKSLGVPLIASVGYKPEEVAALGRRIEKEVGPAAIEFSTHYSGKSIEPLCDVARALRGAVRIPIWMKISPNTPDLENLAKKASDFVDGFVAVNSYGPVLDFDPETCEPRLGSPNGDGWLSGSAILPIALRIVWQLAGVQPKPVIGVGGIDCGVAAIKMIMAGASAVQVCSAAIDKGHTVYGRIAMEIRDWMAQHGVGSIAEIKDRYRTMQKKRMHFKERPIMTISESCQLCKVCQRHCVQGALVVDSKQMRVVEENCIGCGYCQDFCHSHSMHLKERQ